MSEREGQFGKVVWTKSEKKNLCFEMTRKMRKTEKVEVIYDESGYEQYEVAFSLLFETNSQFSLVLLGFEALHSFYFSNLTKLEESHFDLELHVALIVEFRGFSSLFMIMMCSAYTKPKRLERKSET